MKTIINKLNRKRNLTLRDCATLIAHTALAMRNMGLSTIDDIASIVDTFSIRVVDTLPRDTDGTCIPLTGEIKINRRVLYERDDYISRVLKHEICHMLDGEFMDSIQHKDRGLSYADNPREIRARRVENYRRFPRKQHVAWEDCNL